MNELIFGIVIENLFDKISDIESLYKSGNIDAKKCVEEMMLEVQFANFHITGKENT